MPTIQVVLKDRERLEKMLEEVGVELQDLSEELRDTGEFLVDFYAEEVFPSEGRAIGERWMDLKNSTLAQKDKLYPNYPILTRTGSMRDSFNFHANDREMTFFNTSEYFGYHQTGTRRMPQRAIMTENQRIMDEATKIISKGVFERISRVWK